MYMLEMFDNILFQIKKVHLIVCTLLRLLLTVHIINCVHQQDSTDLKLHVFAYRITGLFEILPICVWGVQTHAHVALYRSG